MQTQHNIIIAGAGGIAEAAALLLAAWSKMPHHIFIGDRILPKAEKVAHWVENSMLGISSTTPFHLPGNGMTETFKNILQNGKILLDCLPGDQAPRMARLAKDFSLHYVNLTEYVDETNEIMALAKDAQTGFVLQTGLAPGYVGVLAHGMFQQFCQDYGVEKVDKLEMKVGALTDHAVAPHYFGFTWSPVGVATEYLKNTIAIRNFKKTILPPLTETGKIIIDGVVYEDDLTSGGAADLPDALEGKVKSLDYKTLRYPGHYAWVKHQLDFKKEEDDRLGILQGAMNEAIPFIEDDRIILYVAVEGKDAGGTLRRRETSKTILPKQVGRRTLRAIQTTTAVPMLQAAQMLLETNPKGVILQSQIDAKSFLNGDFIVPVYGATDL
ncbi:MAG: saccharopine dehydrogenase NADP-binding domain-containing protein [Saprospiraceae bacterium]|nr:saccharopine dehydrogenase NADP-binding domain-containing protein [Saprospiraceae bacterium]MCF8250917.1 saccharopine dehydrogenase NADP-binding domain-containing protein [Saprospiraceae bacterium]MCF8283046.1 saccharopine dehydrogenase NADP-binding domain-containing protein [Bacteroidales bacterium]MCF8311882.1 saccharopine dehydrogenase NADP-binding domain-containing protein [Saprospiraceae bacterium]MCF8441890.1 saccharopine dehydrogenase NADP-binding domain-containing protein [Saprospira